MVKRLCGAVADADFEEDERRAQCVKRRLMQRGGEAATAGGGADGKREQGHFVQHGRAGDEGKRRAGYVGGEPDAVVCTGRADVAGDGKGLQGGQVGGRGRADGHGFGAVGC